VVVDGLDQAGLRVDDRAAGVAPVGIEIVADLALVAGVDHPAAAVDFQRQADGMPDHRQRRVVGDRAGATKVERRPIGGGAVEFENSEIGPLLDLPAVQQGVAPINVLGRSLGDWFVAAVFVAKSEDDAGPFAGLGVLDAVAGGHQGVIADQKSRAVAGGRLAGEPFALADPALVLEARLVEPSGPVAGLCLRGGELFGVDEHGGRVGDPAEGLGLGLEVFAPPVFAVDVGFAAGRGAAPVGRRVAVGTGRLRGIDGPAAGEGEDGDEPGRRESRTSVSSRSTTHGISSIESRKKEPKRGETPSLCVVDKSCRSVSSRIRCGRSAA